MSKETFRQNIRQPKDPGSALTHFFGILLVPLAAIPLLIRTVRGNQPSDLFSLGIFALSMLLLYSASTIYHTFDLSPKINLHLKKLDHIMIYVLIAGTYTPICLITLRESSGSFLFLLVWGVALLGILQCVFFVTCPKWVSSILYITMGWLCIFSISDILASMPAAAFGWLLAGGLFYTVGGIIYACKFPVFNRLYKNFGSHEVFHLFVLAGSLCHFVVMYLIAVPAGTFS